MLDAPKRDVRITSGWRQPTKTVAAFGVSLQEISERIGEHL